MSAGAEAERTELSAENASRRRRVAVLEAEVCALADANAVAAELTKQLVAEAARRGLVLLSCGTYANVVRILVPLTASDALLDEGLAILGASFDALA